MGVRTADSEIQGHNIIIQILWLHLAINSKGGLYFSGAVTCTNAVSCFMLSL